MEGIKSKTGRRGGIAAGKRFGFDKAKSNKKNLPRIEDGSLGKGEKNVVRFDPEAPSSIEGSSARWAK